MSFLRKAAIFIGKEIISAACGEIGRHTGDAVGNLIGKRIDPEHGKTPDKDEPDDKEPDDTDKHKDRSAL